MTEPFQIYHRLYSYIYNRESIPVPVPGHIQCCVCIMKFQILHQLVLLGLSQLKRMKFTKDRAFLNERQTEKDSNLSIFSDRVTDSQTCS